MMILWLCLREPVTSSFHLIWFVVEETEIHLSSERRLADVPSFSETLYRTRSYVA